MRVSLDYDNHSILKLLYYLIKGTFICKKLPSEIKKTKRGYHVTFRGLPISENQSNLIRFRLKDDLKRLHLDMSCPKKPHQVLFYRKEIYVHEFDAFGNYVGKKRIQ